MGCQGGEGGRGRGDGGGGGGRSRVSSRGGGSVGGCRSVVHVLRHFQNLLLLKDLLRSRKGIRVGRGGAGRGSYWSIVELRVGSSSFVVVRW